jgi:ATP-dependent DNA helicase RecG
MDRFHLMDGQSVSLRSKISRELVSNILVHREYTSAYPAKIIIERDRIVTENWSLPKVPGRIDPNNFAPYPKNPLLAHFFINIGRADVLGSGVRNLYQFTKLYSGGEPELIDGDVFKTIVPLSLSDTAMSDNVSVKMSNNAHRKPILAYLEKNSEITAVAAAELIGRTSKTARRVLLQLVDEGVVSMSGGNRNRVYRAIKGERDDRA